MDAKISISEFDKSLKNDELFIRKAFNTNPNNWSGETTRKVYDALFNISVRYVNHHSQKDRKNYVTSLYIVLRNIIRQLHGELASVSSQKWGRNIKTRRDLLQDLYIEKLDDYVKKIYKTNVSLTNICVDSKGERV